MTPDPDPEFEYTYTDMIICPYCGHKDRDSWEWGDGEEGDGDTECGSCDLEFSVSRHVSIHYSSRKIEPR